MLRTCLLLAVGVLAATAANADPLTESAYLASRFTIYKSDHDAGVVAGEAGEPVLIITARCYLAHSRVLDGITVVDLETGLPMPGLAIVDWGGLAAKHPERGGDLLSAQYMLAGGLAADGRYEVHIDYGALDAHDDIFGAGGPTADTAASVLEAKPLPAGKTVDSDGKLVDDPTPRYVAPTDARGAHRALPGGHIAITPEVAEDTNQLGANYDLALGLHAADVGWFAPAPGRLQVDLTTTGRVTTDPTDLALAGHHRADLGLRLMLLPGSTHYYPLGLRAAVGYEADEEFRHTNLTATAQLVATIPLLDRLALAWHRLVGVNQAFAPPYISGAYVYSDDPDADGGQPDSSRWQTEAGWTVPVTRRWELSVRWQNFLFTDEPRDDESLFEGRLTYYVDGERDQGLRVSLEEGFRPAVGDVGSTWLLGYLVEGL